MENSNQYEELIVKYLLNELNEEEEAFVVKWIEASEQNRLYFDMLKKTWNASALRTSSTAINVDQEWKQFEQRTSFSKIANEQQAERIDIDDQPNKKAALYRIIISAAVAASLILALAVGGWFFDKNNGIEGGQAVTVEESKKPSTPVALVRHEINTSRKVKKIRLQDGTEVSLAAKSEVSFYEPFIDNRRDITLKGKAVFTVAKDKTRPFTVYSGRLSTTALGTEFSVTAFENHDFIFVRLFEGKVVVKPDYNVLKRKESSYYLKPGQELVFDNRRSLTKVRRFAGNSTAVKKDSEKLFVDTLLMPQNEKGSWFMFHNQPLSVVFNELQNMFDVEITYSKKDISKIYFIGKFDRADSLENILKQIATLNNLKVVKKNNRFIITK